MEPRLKVWSQLKTLRKTNPKSEVTQCVKEDTKATKTGALNTKLWKQNIKINRYDIYV